MKTIKQTQKPNHCKNDSACACHKLNFKLLYRYGNVKTRYAVRKIEIRPCAVRRLKRKKYTVRTGERFLLSHVLQGFNIAVLCY